MLTENQVREVVEDVVTRMGWQVPVATAVKPVVKAAEASPIVVTRELPTKAKAAVLVAKERIELREFPVRPITDDEILVKVQG